MKLLRPQQSRKLRHFIIECFLKRVFRRASNRSNAVVPMQNRRVQFKWPGVVTLRMRVAIVAPANPDFKCRSTLVARSAIRRGLFARDARV